jgi:hypothetical protein
VYAPLTYFACFSFCSWLLLPLGRGKTNFFAQYYREPALNLNLAVSPCSSPVFLAATAAQATTALKYGRMSVLRVDTFHIYKPLFVLNCFRFEPPQ